MMIEVAAATIGISGSCSFVRGHDGIMHLTIDWQRRQLLCYGNSLFIKYCGAEAVCLVLMLKFGSAQASRLKLFFLSGSDVMIAQQATPPLDVPSFSDSCIDLLSPRIIKPTMGLGRSGRLNSLNLFRARLD